MVDDRTAEAWARDELIRLIEIESTSDREHEVMAHLARRVEELDLPAETRRVPGGAPNVIVAWDEHPTLLLTAHTDTIVPTWPWSGAATVEGSVVRGLGATDDKGSVVACLLALLLAREDGVRLEDASVAVALCVDEEVGGKGSRSLADAMKPPFVVAAEGTGLDIAVVETGFVEGSILVHGRTVHASLIEEGDNAIEKAARLIVDLHAAPFTDHEHPIAGRNLPSVHWIEAARKTNAIPDRAELFLSVRVCGSPTLDEVQTQVEEICARHGAEFRLEDRGGWFETPVNAPLVEALADAGERVLGRRPVPTHMPAWTDAHSFVDRAGSQAVVFGPGHLRNAHREDEHIDVREIVACARVFAALIADVSSGTLAQAAGAKEAAR